MKSKGNNQTIWKSKEAFFDDKHVGKIISALKTVSPEVELTYWKDESFDKRGTIYGIQTIEPVGTGRKNYFNSFMNGYWTAVSQ